VKVIVFDLDDTLFETRQWFIQFLNIMGYIVPDTNLYHLETLVPAHLIEFALREAPFMVHARPAPHIHAIFSFLALRNYAVAFCTHRGYHPNGVEYSKTQLRNNGLQGELHCIDPKTYPCKLEYLDQIFEDYVLVDDRPSNLSSANGKVIIYSRPWNLDSDHHLRIENLTQLPRLLEVL
jgi:5'(3')-deoxyribonucleotidase